MPDDQTLSWNPDRRRRLDEAIAEYRDEVAPGVVPDPAAFASRYPDLAPELEEHLINQGWADEVAAPRRRTPPASIPGWPDVADLTTAAEAATGSGAPQSSPPSSHDTTLDAPRHPPSGTAPASSEQLPMTFGNYVLIRLLGSGGMGMVHEARQLGLNRLVALKRIRSGVLADDDERRRFHDEAQVVAQLDHPHIVPIYEIGEHGGQLYFTMRLIPGGSLSRRIGNFRQKPRLAARVMIVLADAVHHAHQRGILHSDLKPGNILLDDQGNGYVTDFGLAKFIEPGRNGVILRGIEGTPAYMAPEQAEGRTGTVTTLTDVYGLGTILYAMLTSVAPFQSDSAMATIEAVKKRPPEPPTRLVAAVPRDLEAICLKCLEKAPEARYTSAQALREDLQRYLDGHPTAVRPVGAMTRVGMWCRRQPALAAMLGVLGLALVGGAAGITWNWLEVRVQRDRVIRERNAAVALSDYLIEGVIYQASPDLAGNANVTVAQALDQAAQVVEGRFRDRRDVESQIRHALGRSYLALGRLDAADRQLTQSLELGLGLGPAFEEQRLTTLATLAGLRREQRRLDEAQSLARGAERGLLQHLGPAHPKTLDTQILLAMLESDRNRPEEAERQLRAVVDRCEKLLADDHATQLRALVTLAGLDIKRNRPDEALPILRKSLRIATAKWGAEHPQTLSIRNNLVAALLAAHQPDEANRISLATLEDAQRALGEHHPLTQSIHNNRNAAQFALGLANVGPLRERLEALRHSLSETHPKTQLARQNLAIGLMQLDTPEAVIEAERLMSQAAASLQRDNPEDPLVLQVLTNWAGILLDLNRPQDAEAPIRAALKLAQENQDHAAAVLDLKLMLGWVLTSQGPQDEAERLIRAVLEARVQTLPASAWQIGNAESLLGGALLAQGRYQEAEPLLVAGHAAMYAAIDTPPIRSRQALDRLVRLYEAWGRTDQADVWRARRQEESRSTATQSALTPSPEKPTPTIPRAPSP